MARAVSMRTVPVCGGRLFARDQTVCINGAPIITVGDLHACPRCKPHSGVVVSGSVRIYVNGREVATARHRVSCCCHPIGDGHPDIDIT